MQGSKTWAILLAAGDGRRLEGISRDPAGRPAPKQFCSFGTGQSLFGRALGRARRVAEGHRVLPVVAEHHREWWTAVLAREALPEIVVQPRNRGTGPGALLPLWRIAHRDPDAVVVLLPCDHFVEDEDLFASSIRTATRHVEQHPEEVVLLGITPEAAESEYGWIVPEGYEEGGLRRVARFVEKPPPHTAARLMNQGGLWNSFVLAFRARALLTTYRQTQRALWDHFSRHLGETGSENLEDLYAEMPSADFSRDILEVVPQRLRVLRTPPCGWTDLGTPSRLSAWRARRDVPAMT